MTYQAADPPREIPSVPPAPGKVAGPGPAPDGKPKLAETPPPPGKPRKRKPEPPPALKPQLSLF